MILKLFGREGAVDFLDLGFLENVLIDKFTKCEKFLCGRNQKVGRFLLIELTLDKKQKSEGLFEIIFARIAGKFTLRLWSQSQRHPYSVFLPYVSACLFFKPIQ
jgi:hypothetical protein